MRLVSFTTPDGGDRLGLVDGDPADPDATTVTDLTDLVRAHTDAAGLSPMRALAGAWDALRGSLTPDDGPTLALRDLALAPVVPDPGTVLAAPVNYHDHMVEMSQTSHVGALGVFLKAPASVLAHGGTVQLPYTDRRFDHEGELAVVIGREARHVAEADALDHVLGYTGCLDITMRGGEDRSLRKSFATFTPLGPWLVTADEVDADDVDLVCAVDGHVRQRASTRDLIWSVAALVAYASSAYPLRPGDVLTTGTPAGVGEVVAGQEVTLSLSGLPDLRVAVAADHAVACPTSGAGRGPVPPPTPEPAGVR
ncbi:fumarylacetoacetate hydrolase family protein [Actinomycetospora sp. NBC_00405]|uniref:fumarylacetoacetate hydrolase family protein n=1 Tax=Actinomycetospora sp. NBC_00405 TaxID=2975952 RepID=UPI002E203223